MNDVVENQEVKKCLDEIQKGFEQFKSANDEKLLQASKKLEDVCTTEKVNRINDDLNKKYSDLENEIIKIKREAIFTGNANTQNNQPAEALAYKNALAGYLKSGDLHVSNRELKSLEDSAFSALKLKAVSVNDDTSGGYTVLPEVDVMLRQLQVVLSPMRSVCQVVNTSRNAYEVFFDMNNAGFGFVGETEARVETGTPALKRIDIPMCEIYANPIATQTALDDSFLNVEQWLTNAVATSFAQGEGISFITGDGVKRPRGLLTFPVVADASWSWGNVGYIPTGAAGAFTAHTATVGTGADVLNTLVAALKPAYRANAKFLANRKTIAAIRNLKNSQGDYLLQPSMVAGTPQTLLGYPIVEMEAMPDIAASSLSIAFGDFSKAYLIVDRMGTRVIRDVYTNKPYVTFYTTKRFSGAVQNFEAFKLLRFSAS